MPNYPRCCKKTEELKSFIDQMLENNSSATYEEVDRAVKTAFGKSLSKPVYNQRLLYLRREKRQEEKEKKILA